MSDIFQEVDEEVRRDKAVEFCTKNQNLIFAAAVVIVLATGGYRYYEYRRLQASEAAGAAFQQALSNSSIGTARPRKPERRSRKSRRTRPGATRRWRGSPRRR